MDVEWSALNRADVMSSCVGEHGEPYSGRHDVMGMRVDASAFARTDVLGLAALLTLAATIGRPLDRLSIDRTDAPRRSRPDLREHRSVMKS